MILRLPHPQTHKKQGLTVVVLRELQGKMTHLMITLKLAEKLAIQREKSLDAYTAESQPPAGSREAAIFGIKTDQTEPAHDWMSSCFSGLSTTTYIKGVPSPIACHMKVTEGFLYLLEEGTCTCGTDNMLLLLLLPLLLPLLLE